MRLCFQMVLVGCLLWGVVGVWGVQSKHPYVDPADSDDPWRSIEFSFLVDAGAEECFHQRVREGTKFELNYQATSREVQHNMRVAVRSHTNQVIYMSHSKLEDEFETLVTRDDTYTICFGNRASRRYPKKVSMTVSILDEAKIKEYFQLQEEVESHLVNASASVRKIWVFMWRISREQFRLRGSTMSDQAFMVNNADYILYWSLFQAIIIVTAGVAQVWALRSLFNVKVLTPTQKPRC